LRTEKNQRRFAPTQTGRLASEPLAAFRRNHRPESSEYAKKLPEETRMISLHTDGLKKIHPIGLDVFHRFIQSSRTNSGKIVFTGKHASRLSKFRLAFEQSFR
jgi:hypothetical protein